MQHSDFSSWPPAQEQMFAVYEQRASESSRKAWTVGLGVGGALFLVIVAIVLAIPPEKKDLTRGMDTSSFEKGEKVEAKPAAKK